MELPYGWINTNLGSATQPTQKRVNPKDYPDLPYIGMENIEAHTMRLLGTVPGREMRSAADKFSAGDVLYGRLRPYLNKVYCPDFDGLCSTEFIVFRKTPDVYSKYLQYFLNSWEFVTFANSLNAGDRPRVKFEQLADYPFPLPPLPEQERIIARIESLFSQIEAGVAGLKRAQAGLKRYRASVLKAACEGRLVHEYSRSRNLVFDTDLPEGWVWKSASEFCDAVESGSTPKADLMTSDEGEIPFIKVYNLTFDGRLDFSVKPTYISRETQNTSLKRSKVYPGDVLTNIVGPPLGKVSIVPKSYPEWNINQAVVLFRTGKTVDNKYLSIVLQSPNFLRRIKATAKATAGQYNISLSTCRRIPMPIPPLDEQRLIVEEVEQRLSMAAEVERSVAEGLARAGRLRQAILKRAFEGRLG